MLFSRMLALAPVLMMMGAGGAAANAGAFEDDYSAYDEALGVMEVRTPAAKKQKQLDYSTDDDPYGVYEITDDGEGLDCYDVELERIQNEQVEGEDELDELDEGEVLDLKPIVKERRTSYTLAEKMRYVDLCDAAWRANPNGPCVEIAVSGVQPLSATKTRQLFHRPQRTLSAPSATLFSMPRGAHLQLTSSCPNLAIVSS
jgi:hypothetical protein